MGSYHILGKERKKERERGRREGREGGREELRIKQCLRDLEQCPAHSKFSINAE